MPPPRRAAGSSRAEPSRPVSWWEPSLRHLERDGLRSSEGERLNPGIDRAEEDDARGGDGLTVVPVEDRHVRRWRPVGDLPDLVAARALALLGDRSRQVAVLLPSEEVVQGERERQELGEVTRRGAVEQRGLDRLVADLQADLHPDRFLPRGLRRRVRPMTSGLLRLGAGRVERERQGDDRERGGHGRARLSNTAFTTGIAEKTLGHPA